MFYPTYNHSFLRYSGLVKGGPWRHSTARFLCCFCAFLSSHKATAAPSPEPCPTVPAHDLDGDDDLILANSHPDDQIGKLSSTLTYREPLLLLENTGGKFANVDARAGEAFRKEWPARGLAVGDLDNDGMPDVVVGNTGEAPLILHHTGAGAGNWIGLDLQPRVAGTLLRWSAAGAVRTKLLNAGGSFLSAQDPRVVLGLGTAAAPDWIEVRWPGGQPRRLEPREARRYHRIER